MKCSICESKGGWWDDMGIDGYSQYEKCGHCMGKGTISLRKWLLYWFWNTAPVEFIEWYDSWRYK